MQLLIASFRTKAKRLVLLGFSISPGELAASYTALMQHVMRMGGTIQRQPQPEVWSVRNSLSSASMVVITDWGAAVISSVRQLFPHAHHQ